MESHWESSSDFRLGPYTADGQHKTSSVGCCGFVFVSDRFFWVFLNLSFFCFYVLWCVCVSCAFLISVFFFYSDLFAFLFACLFSKEEREEVRLERWRGGEDLGGLGDAKPISEYTT